MVDQKKISPLSFLINSTHSNPQGVQVENGIDFCEINNQCKKNEICINQPELFRSECEKCPKGHVKLTDRECLDCQCNNEAEFCQLNTNTKKPKCLCKKGYKVDPYNKDKGCQKVGDPCEGVVCGEDERCFVENSFNYSCKNVCTYNNGDFAKRFCDMSTEICHYTHALEKVWCSCKEGFGKRAGNIDEHCIPHPSKEEVCSDTICKDSEKCYVNEDDKFSSICSSPCDNKEDNTCNEVTESCSYSAFFGNGKVTCACKLDGHKKINGVCQGPPDNVCEGVTCGSGLKCYTDKNDKFKHKCLDPCTQDDNTCDSLTQDCRVSLSTGIITCPCKSGYEIHESTCKIPPVGGPCADHNCLDNQKCYTFPNNNFDKECDDPCSRENLCTGSNEKCSYSATSNSHQCDCEEGFLRNRQKICARPPNDVCSTASCDSTLKCYADPNDNFNYLCEDPCLRENLCPGENEVCTYNNSLGHTCNCANNHQKNNGVCTKIPDNICSSQPCENPAHKCYKNESDPFKRTCEDPCQRTDEITCKLEENEICQYKNDIVSCECTLPIMRKIEGRCTLPPSDLCSPEAKDQCPNETDICTPNPNDPWSIICKNPCDPNPCNQDENCISVEQEPVCSCPEGTEKWEGQCQTPPDNVCENHSCQSDEICVPLNKFGHRCKNPCLDENPCLIENQICSISNHIKKCACPENTLEREGKCTDKPVCDNVGCPNNKKCYEDSNQVKGYICKDPCSTHDNHCGDNFVCSYVNRKIQCDCEENFREIIDEKGNKVCAAEVDNINDTTTQRTNISAGPSPSDLDDNSNSNQTSNQGQSRTLLSKIKANLLIVILIIIAILILIIIIVVVCIIRKRKKSKAVDYHTTDGNVDAEYETLKKRQERTGAPPNIVEFNQSYGSPSNNEFSSTTPSHYDVAYEKIIPDANTIPMDVYNTTTQHSTTPITTNTDNYLDEAQRRFAGEWSDEEESGHATFGV